MVIDRFIPWMFVLLALPSVLIFSKLTPPFQVPDEIEHYYYARAVSGGGVFPVQLPGGLRRQDLGADHDLVMAFHDIIRNPKVKVTSEGLSVAANTKDLAPLNQNFWGAAIYPPIAYAVPAIFLKLSDAIGLNTLQAFFVGRSANALLFVFVAFCALTILPVAKIAFLFALLLPMTLTQAASYSPDGLVISMSALICAMISVQSTKHVPEKYSVIFISLCILLVSLIKAPLVALAMSGGQRAGCQ